MRFAYCPETGQLTIYATTEEFQLASFHDGKGGEQEFRVVLKELKNRDGSVDPSAIYKFLNQYVKFVKDIFGDLYPDEKIKDILVLSTMPKLGFTWTSLLDIDKFGSSLNFMDMITSYAFSAIEDTNLDKKTQTGKSLIELLSERDFAKLTLAKVLLSSINHPTVWKQKQRPDKQKEDFLKRMDSLKNKLSRFERKYGFESKEMHKYYKDDQFPESDMEEWLKVYTEYQMMQLSIEKFSLVENITDNWMKSFK
jgi:hypothetical protein